MTATSPVSPVLVPATGCCPRFDPAPWDGTEIAFDNRRFVKDRVRSLFHVPLNFGSVMARNMTKIAAADAVDPERIVLADENSLWGADVYIGVSQEVPGADNVRLSGRFLSKVFEGPYRDVRKWMRRMAEHVAATGKASGRIFCYYTTCPKCAKVYGKNHVVLLAEI